MKSLLLALFFINISAFAQDEIPVMNIDLMSFCKSPATDDKNADLISEKNSTCNKIRELQNANVQPVVLDKKDKDGHSWKFRFHFGFTRTNYLKTDLHIQSSVINVVVKDVEMVERTSANHYDPTTWHHLQNAAQWIDEPTNTFTFSLEKNNNVFYLTVFHPKYLKSLVYSKSEVEGETKYNFSPIQESNDFSVPIPENHEFLYLGNTHYNMIWQIGYGRQFVIFDHKRAGKLSYTLKGDVGITTGKARSIHVVPGVAWDDYYDHERVQGYNASIGHRLEYQRGIVSMFIDEKAMYSKMQHGFYDGTINYNLVELPTTFGIGVELFTKSKRDRP